MFSFEWKRLSFSCNFQRTVFQAASNEAYVPMGFLPHVNKWQSSFPGYTSIFAVRPPLCCVCLEFFESSLSVCLPKGGVETRVAIHSGWDVYHKNWEVLRWVGRGVSQTLPEISHIRDHSRYGLSRWEKALLGNAFSHWLSPYLEWSLGSWYGLSQWQKVLLCNAFAHRLNPYLEWSRDCVGYFE